MTDFINASIGGLLIAFAAILMLAFLGRISGISGILWQAISNPDNSPISSNGWRWFFLAGLLIGPFLAHQVLGFSQPEPSDAGLIMAIVAGLLVGFGTKLGSGCTSGHGICGISRFSIRSLVATLCFIGSGVVTVFITQQLL